MSKLFSPAQLGQLTLQNHLVMAPMTRSRSVGNVPGELVADYYGQRATAGLIITEGTSPSPNGLGYARIPGIYSPEQVEGWRAVANAVHAKGGKIFVQLMHCGRVAHPANLPAGGRVVGASAVAAAGEMYTDSQGMQPHPVPHAMSVQELGATVQEFVQAAKNAVAAGLDGVELHAANGYLLEQFIRPTSNQRTDAYGGPIANRARFVLEVVDATVAAIGKDKVGIRLSPFGVFNDMPVYPDMEADYLYLAEQLSARGLVYLHVLDHSPMGAPAVPASIKTALRAAFKGTYILCGGFDASTAEAALQSGQADLIAVGRQFISNPDLVARWQKGAELAAPDFGTFYTPGAKGYTDYPALG